MSATDSTRLPDLIEADIDVRPLKPAISTLAATGIEFRGLERVHFIPVLEWKGVGRKRARASSEREP